LQIEPLSDDGTANGAHVHRSELLVNPQIDRPAARQKRK
jgi:hypothetical protein